MALQCNIQKFAKFRNFSNKINDIYSSHQWSSIDIPTVHKLNFTFPPTEVFNSFRQFGRNYLHHILTSRILFILIEYCSAVCVDLCPKLRRKKPLGKQSRKRDRTNGKTITIRDFDCND